MLLTRRITPQSSTASRPPTPSLQVIKVINAFVWITCVVVLSLAGVSATTTVAVSTVLALGSTLLMTVRAKERNGHPVTLTTLWVAHTTTFTPDELLSLASSIPTVRGYFVENIAGYLHGPMPPLALPTSVVESVDERSDEASEAQNSQDASNATQEQMLALPHPELEREHPRNQLPSYVGALDVQDEANTYRLAVSTAKEATVRVLFMGKHPTRVVWVVPISLLGRFDLSQLSWRLSIRYAPKYRAGVMVTREANIKLPANLFVRSAEIQLSRAQ